MDIIALFHLWKKWNDLINDEDTKKGVAIVEFHSYHFICLAPMMLFAFLTSHADPAQPVGFEERVCHQHNTRHSTGPKGVRPAKQNPPSTKLPV